MVSIWMQSRWAWWSSAIYALCMLWKRVVCICLSHQNVIEISSLSAFFELLKHPPCVVCTSFGVIFVHAYVLHTQVVGWLVGLADFDSLIWFSCWQMIQQFPWTAVRSEFSARAGDSHNQSCACFSVHWSVCSSISFSSLVSLVSSCVSWTWTEVLTNLFSSLRDAAPRSSGGGSCSRGRYVPASLARQCSQFDAEAYEGWREEEHKKSWHIHKLSTSTVITGYLESLLVLTPVLLSSLLALRTPSPVTAKAGEGDSYIFRLVGDSSRLAVTVTLLLGETDSSVLAEALIMSKNRFVRMTKPTCLLS